MDTYYYYKITNIIDDDVYIGSTKNPYDRWIKHKNVKIKKCVINHKMSDLGISNFSFHIIDTKEFVNKQDALELEDFYMKEYNSINLNCASNKQQKLNKKIYQKEYDKSDKVKKYQKEYRQLDTSKEKDREYNNREEVKIRKSNWAKEKHKNNYVIGKSLNKN